MQGYQLKQIKPSPALHAEHTWWAHAHHATPHTDAGRRTKQPLTTFHLIQLVREKNLLSVEHGKASHGKEWR